MCNEPSTIELLIVGIFYFWTMTFKEWIKMTGNEFSVYQFFEDGSYERVRQFVSVEEAAKAADHYCHSIAVTLGIVVRVIVTDGGDCICFEWKRGEGIVFPPKESN